MYVCMIVSEILQFIPLQTSRYKLGLILLDSFDTNVNFQALKPKVYTASSYNVLAS